ncbi:MAG: hypothetical protein ABL989_11835 [Gammaproteobacteria bacterium]
MTVLVIPRTLLDHTRTVLRQRSAGWRESAGVWLGRADGAVCDAVFHHELADDRATALSLELPESAKIKLYQRAAAAGYRLLALLHTHPDSWVDLSPIDQRNQLSSRIGFWSIVLPHYGQGPWHLGAVGFHVRHDRGWSRLAPTTVAERLMVEER